VPLVSVIIPCFNGADHVGTAIESALTQTLTDIEVIVVDDGSTDGTALVLQPYLVDTRVHYLYQQNRGLPGARNTGARASRFSYLAFLDADDQLAPHAIETMLQELLRSGSAWCLIDILKRTPAGEEIQRTMVPNENVFYSILKDDFIRRGMFFQRDSFFAVGMYDEEMRNREDWDLNIRMFARGLPYSYLSQPLYLYTWREGSITRNRARVLDYTEKLLDKHHKRLADAGDRKASTIYAALLWDLGRQRLYHASDLRGALRSVTQSLRYDFRLGRIFHPLAHQIRRLLHANLPPPKRTESVVDNSTR
jgi:glycosyltransferase involved in cell wall biosynthesis